MTVKDFYAKACEHFNFSGWRITNDIIYLENTDGSVTEKQIKDKAQELFQEWQNLQYQRDRATSYPSIQEQLDMQYWDAVNGTKKWQEAVAKVKTDNPKPE